MNKLMHTTKNSIRWVTLILSILFLNTMNFPIEANNCSNLLNTVVKDIDGHEVNLCKYQGKVILVVNTASRCGFTGQYGDLEKVYKKYKERGLEVLAFPSNDFAGQEPGNEEQIKKFCQINYDVSFPMFAKVHVRGREQSPIYEKLTSSKGTVQWNFQKYLINKKGQVVKKFAPWIKPISSPLETAILEELTK
jgi:glutathione peroxidase